MIIVRIVKGIAGHLPSRAPEWALAVVLFNWGWVLLRSGSTFANPIYSQLAKWASEDVWGVACFSMGLLRLSALVINGTFHHRFRHSPHVRSVMAFWSCFFWFSITIGMLQVDLNSTGLAVYPVLLILDMYNAMRAARDAREVDEAARHARAA